jgi:hypothetical protein
MLEDGTWKRQGRQDCFHYQNKLAFYKNGEYVEEQSYQNRSGKNYIVPSRDGDQLIRLHYHPNSSEFVLEAMKVISIKDISMMFLLHLNEDLDDDVIRILAMTHGGQPFFGIIRQKLS